MNVAFLHWLRPNRGRRFLGWLHYMDVHEPYWPPAEFRSAAPEGVRPAVARGRLAGIAERGNWSSGPSLNAAEVQHLQNLYDGGIRFWDVELERFLDGLAALGMRDSTIRLAMVSLTSASSKSRDARGSHPRRATSRCVFMSGRSRASRPFARRVVFRAALMRSPAIVERPSHGTRRWASGCARSGT